MKKVFATMTVALAFMALTVSANAVPVKDIDLDISGVAQIGYSFSGIDGANDQLDVNRLRLRIKGNVNPEIGFFTELELGSNMSGDYAYSDIPAGNPKTNDMVNLTPAAGSRWAQKDMGADSRIVLGYVDLKYWAKSSILKTVRIGQMPRGSGYELSVPVDKLETINYSTNVGQFHKITRGIQFKMKPAKHWKFGIGIDNGNGGITGTGSAVNDSMTIGTKLVYVPSTKFQAKAFFRKIKDTITSPDAGCYGGGMIYKDSGFRFRGELYTCNPDPIDLGTKIKKESDMTSWYTQFSYFIPETDVQLVSRYNRFDKTVGWNDGTIPAEIYDYDIDIITAGFNWNFDKNARLQVMHEFVSGDSAQNTEFNDSTDVQLQITF